MPRRGTDKLADLHPELAEEWMVEENKPQVFEQMSTGSKFVAQWRCRKNAQHVWPARVNHRANGRGCPYCSGRLATPDTSLLALYPKIAAEWHPTENGTVTPDQVKPHSHKHAVWQCPVNPLHKWSADISSRVRGNGCPICSNRVATAENSLLSMYPALAQEWHPTENGSLTPADVVPGSERVVVWQCRVNPTHVWPAMVRNRAILGSKCLFCAGQIATPETSLLAINPALAQQWHPTENGDLTPARVLPHSNQYVWWLCSRDPSHKWPATINSRSAGSNCSYCAGQRVTPTTSLAELFPQLAREWHPDKNALTPDLVRPGSGRLVTWRCAQGHEWEARIQHRAQGIGCPFCSGQRATLETSLAACFPDLAREWHPTKNGSVAPEQVKPRSNLRAWWQCLKDPSHPAWQATVDNRTTHGSGCPQCREILGSADEDRFANALEALGIRYERQKIIGPYRADFFLIDYHLLVEIQGCYWHGCLQCGYDADIHKQFRRKDVRRRHYLEKKGYHIEEVWEHDLPREIGDLIELILGVKKKWTEKQR